jgi:copper chaperone NosL
MFRRHAVFPVVLLLLTISSFGIVATACGSRAKPKPIEIVLNEDSCAQCRMAVSQRPFAAEIAKPSGTADVFDDIGCLVTYVKEKGLPESSAVYVTDFKTGAWLDAQTACYLWARDLATPMSYGLAAFVSAQDAEDSVKQWPGKTVNWQTLLAEFKP